MVFAPETEQSGKESPTELFFHDSKEKLPFSHVKSLGPTATQGASNSPMHLWEGRYGCYGLRRDLLGAGEAEPTAGWSAHFCCCNVEQMGHPL